MPSFSKSTLYLVIAAPVLAAAVAVGCSDGTSSSGSASTLSSGSASTGTAGGGASDGTGGSGAAGNGGSGATGGTGGTGGGVGGGGVGGAGATGGAGGAPPMVIAYCQNQVYQCGNTIDDDMDGLIDSQDPDCLGPCDNTENGYYGGIPGQAGPGCLQDCYWDSNSGSGNDGCYWNHKCDPLSVAPNYYPEWWYGNKCVYDPNANTSGTPLSCDELLNTQPATCLEICPQLTPNGCDCFGCCELPAGSGSFVWLGTEDGAGNGTCNIANLADPKKCSPCTPVKGACYNSCGKCELCIGKDTLPPECFPDPTTSSASVGVGGASASASSGAGGSGGGSTAQCPGGEQACGLAGQAPCPAGYYCITGCCIPQPK
jgi:hypothetical protein